MKPLIDLQYSKFLAWKNRSTYPNFHYPGVYAISICEFNLAGRDFSWEHVVYIGMTTTSLKQRLYGFHRAIHGKRGHSGGNTMYKTYQSVGTEIDLDSIFVAMMGISCDVKTPTASDLRTLGNVVYLEYEAFAQYYEASGGNKPKFNTQ